MAVTKLKMPVCRRVQCEHILRASDK